jgi:hypothetical protein
MQVALAEAVRVAEERLAEQYEQALAAAQEAEEHAAQVQRSIEPVSACCPVVRTVLDHAQRRSWLPYVPPRGATAYT